MSSGYRPALAPDRTPIQSSLAGSGSQYTHYRMNSPMLGIVLEVYPADHEKNRASVNTVDRRGSMHMCSVLIVDSNSPSQIVLPNVVLTPDAPTGLDNFYETLPRGCSNLTDGQTFEPSMANLDTTTLDGDWCVVGFIGGNIDKPFVMRWWCHIKNTLDPQTTNNGNPDASGTPQSLDQTNRHFSRVNGVETVINKDGDIYISTALAGSTLQFSQNQTPTKGRWTRQTPTDYGGGILVNVKNSQTLELVWDELKEGVGIMGRAEEALPQTNPKQVNQTQDEYESTYVMVDKDRVKIDTPSNMDLLCGDSIKITSDNETILTSTNLLELESPSIKLGTNAEQFAVRATDLQTWLSNLTVLTAMGPARINPADIATFLTQVASTKVKVE